MAMATIPSATCWPKHGGWQLGPAAISGRQWQECSKRVSGGWGFSSTLHLLGVEPSWCGQQQRRSKSILTPHYQPRERQSLKAVEFLWLHWLSFPIPQLWAWSVRRWHLFCPDAEGEGCGGEGLVLGFCTRVMRRPIRGCRPHPFLSLATE